MTNPDNLIKHLVEEGARQLGWVTPEMLEMNVEAKLRFIKLVEAMRKACESCPHGSCPALAEHGVHAQRGRAER